MGRTLRLGKHVSRLERRPGGRRQGRLGASPSHRLLRIETLETRLALTGNLAAVGAYLTNSSGQTVSSLASGEVVFVAVEFTTQNLPKSAMYGINCTFNGVTVGTGDSINAGAGVRAEEGWTLSGYFGEFIATPGTNQVIFVVDPDNSVPGANHTDNTWSGSFTASPQVSGNAYSYSPAQIRAAYGINSIPNFGSTPADGTGQTIAIVDPYNDPTVFSDLDSFDQVMGLSINSTETLYQQYGPASSFLTVYNDSGTNITADVGSSGSDGVPPVDPTGEAELEESLDVQWAHSVAPGAKIDLVECDSFNDIFSGEATAAGLPGVTVVSNSWGGPEASNETSYDSYFTAPGVTFLASSGDSGAPPTYPSASPDVVAVGGTQLTLNNNAYSSETGWNFSTPRTLENGTSSYSQTGSWSSPSGGFSGSYSSAAAGSASTATWTTSISTSDEGQGGGVEVSATWLAAAGNATNATYEIYDGTAATGTLLGTATVDQTQSPVGISDGNTQFPFQDLGVYYPQSGTLTVVLSAASANGTVVADAVGIVADWAGSGGQSQVESEPSYQLAIQNSGFRTTPDVAFDASGNSGVFICDDGDFYYGVGGTSLGSPSWAGLIAIANQGIVADGGTTLNSGDNPTQTLQDLYSLPTGDFHDITSGYNGLSAGPGYDEVTGLGSPYANLLVPDLVNLPFLPFSLSQSSVSVGTASILPGDTTTVNLTAREADGSQEPSGGLLVTFSLAGDSTGSGTFSAVTDNGNGTYSATFTGTTAGSISIAATIDRYSVTSAPPALTVLSPAVTAASTTTAAGVYPAGTVIPITLTFNEPVTVSGTPQLALNPGGGATATYSGGSGTSALTFDYTVGAGQNSSDLDYASIAALGLNGGSIQDANRNAAILTLPATGRDGLATANIVVDTATLTVTAADWTAAGLTLLLDANGNVHVYTTGTTTDVVVPLPLATLTNIEITSPDSSSYQLTIDTTGGDPIPAGGLSYSGGGGLIVTGSGTIPLSGTNIYTGGTTISVGTVILTNSSALPSGTGLTVGAGATVEFSAPSGGANETTTVSDAASAITSSDTIATSAVPSITSSAASSPVLLAPTATAVSASVRIALPGSASAVVASTMLWLQSPAAVELKPSALPRLSLSTVVNNSNSGDTWMPILLPAVSELQTVARRTVASGLLPSLQLLSAASSRTSVVDHVVGSPVATSAVGDLAWLRQATDGSDGADQNRKKDVAILALDAVIAQ